MKKIILALCGLCFAVAANGQEVIKSSEIGDFQVITLAGNLNVELIPADENAIEVTLRESAADKFRWSVNSGGVLAMALRPTVGRNARADVRIYYKDMLREVTADGGSLKATEPIEAHCLRVGISGGANVNLAVVARDMEFDARGNSAAMLTGDVKYLNINASERTRIDSRGMKSVSAEIGAAMGSEVYVNAEERIVAQTRNGATIYHVGAPTILKNRSFKRGLGGGVFSIGESRQALQ